MTLPVPDELTEALSAFVAGLELDAIDAETLQASKKLVLDVVGAGLAGRDAEAVTDLREMIQDIGGKPEAGMLGVSGRVPAHSAATVNGAACRALEIDDVHETAVNHVSATVVPAAIAAAQAAGRVVSGAEFLTAVVAGMEVAVRMSLAARPLDSWGDVDARRGMSTTYQVGVFAAAVTAAKIWRIPRERMPFVFGFAYSGASGNQQGTYDGAQVIRIQQGLSAGTGVFAARLARAGLTAATRPLEGDAGYYNLYWRGRHDRSLILDGLGERFHVAGISIKPYPCCKCIHNSMTAAAEIRREAPADPAEICRVEVVVPSREYYFTVSHPHERKQRPANFVEAQFSLPYAVALTLVRGLPSLPDYRAGLEDTEVMALATRVDSVLREGDATPAPATVTVEYRNRPAETRRVSLSIGHPDLPMSWERLEEKFLQVAAFGPGAPSAEIRHAIARAVAGIESLADVDADLLGLLTSEPTAA